MKIFLCIISLLFGMALNSQVLYDELEPHNAENVNLLYVANDGTFIGRFTFSNALLKSNDNGLTWQYIKNANLKPWAKVSITEDTNGTLYLSHFTDLFSLKVNEDSLALIQFGQDISVDELLALSDNTLFGFHYRGSYLINPVDKTIEQIEDTRGFKALLGDNAHYVLDRLNHVSTIRKLKKFDLSFNIIGTYEFRADSLYEHYALFNDRLFTSYGYTDDGINWVKFPNGIKGDLHVNNSGVVSILTSDKLFISHDFGESFEESNFTLPFLNEGSFSLGPMGVVYYRNSCENAGLYFSKNGTDSWTYRREELNLGFPYAQKIKVFDQSNLYVRSCDKYDLHKSRIDNSWKGINVNRGNLSSDLIVFEDGVVVGSSGIKSENYGEDWERGSISLKSELGIQCLNETLYAVDSHYIHKSEDRGASWESIAFEGEGFNCAEEISHPFAITKDESLLNIKFFENYICRHKFDGTFIERYPCNPGEFELTNICTTDEGYLFWISRRPPATSSIDVYDQLVYSYDNGLTFNYLPITMSNVEHIYIDRLKNLYLNNFFRNSLHISSDGGFTWKDITPTNAFLSKINDINVGYDNHLYIATDGTPILRSKEPLSEASLPVSTSTINPAIENVISLHPNPSDGYINIKIEGEQRIDKIQIFNTNGKQCLEIESNINSFSNESLPKGYYTLRVKFKNGSFSIVPFVKS